MPRGRPSRHTVYQRLKEAIDDLNSRLEGLPTPVEAGARPAVDLVLEEVAKAVDEARRASR